MTNLNLTVSIFVIFILLVQIKAVPKFDVSKNSILNLIPVWLTPLTTNDQNSKIAHMLLNCSYIVRNINQCGNNFIDETSTILTSQQKSKVVNAASKYLLKVGPTAKTHIDLFYNAIYNGVKAPIWDKSQNLAKKYKKFENYKSFVADMVKKAFNKKMVCNVAKNVKTKIGTNAWQAARDYFGDIAVIISKCAL